MPPKTCGAPSASTHLTTPPTSLSTRTGSATAASGSGQPPEPSARSASGLSAPSTRGHLTTAPRRMAPGAPWPASDEGEFIPALQRAQPEAGPPGATAMALAGFRARGAVTPQRGAGGGRAGLRQPLMLTAGQDPQPGADYGRGPAAPAAADGKHLLQAATAAGPPGEATTSTRDLCSWRSASPQLAGGGRGAWLTVTC